MDNFENILGGLQYSTAKGEFNKSKYYLLISELLKEIHAKIPREEFDPHKVPTPTNIREEIFNGVNYKRAVTFLLSNGCEWALKNGHGCTMCGHLAKQLRTQESIPEEDLLYQFEEEFMNIDFKKYPILNLYNNGSFLNDNEIPPRSRAEILKKIGRQKDIKMLVLETRPEFVTEDKIKEIKMLVPDKHVEVGVGLEMKNDLYRTICINKGFSLKQYDHAAQIITKYIYLRTYVLLKPIFLTERESIEHAVETIEHAMVSGSRTVSLEACTVQDYTLVACLYEQGVYQTPWLWSILEVIKRTNVKHKGKLVIGLFQFYPSPSKTPYNCKKCSDEVLEAICRYNRTLDRSHFDDLSCECKKKWEAVMAEEPPSFNERLKLAMNKLKLII
jgi:radical SAM enzyme (TIGR01210 family)